MEPVTIRRIGAAHDSDGAESASHLRSMLKNGGEPWFLMPEKCAETLKSEIAAGRGPVFLENAEAAVLSRLRMLPDEAFEQLPDASEGLAKRLARYARTMPTVGAVLENAKTKRYALDRLRRILLCAALGLKAEDALQPPPISVFWQ
jgi:predicted nucleotidyltransferase